MKKRLNYAGSENKKNYAGSENHSPHQLRKRSHFGIEYRKAAPPRKRYVETQQWTHPKPKRRRGGQVVGGQEKRA